MQGVDIPRQMSQLLDQLFRTKNQFARQAQLIGSIARANNGNGDTPIPTVVPNQVGYLPKLRGEILCGGQNSVFQCASLGDIGSSIGNAILDVLEQSNLQYMNDEAFSFLDQFYKSATLGLTDTLIDTIELEPLVQTLEQVYKKLLADNINILHPKNAPPGLELSGASHLPPGKQNLLTGAYESVIDNLVFNAADRMAFTETKVRGVADKVSDFVTCNAFPGCRERQREVQALSSNDSLETVRLLENSERMAGTSLARNVYVYGFVDSCATQHACVSTYKDMIPELFDGLYEVELVSDTEVVYARALVDQADSEAVARWKQLYKEALPVLYLWMRAAAPSSSPEPSYTMAITAEVPLSINKHKFVASRPPYAVLAEPCSILDPVMCAERSHWFLQAHSTYGCTHGLKHQDLCVYPAKVDVLPAKVSLEIEGDEVNDYT